RFPKAGAYDNELSRYRYDAILRIGEMKEELAEPPCWIDWDAAGRWRTRVRESRTSIGVTGIRDGRATQTSEGDDLNRIFELARELGVETAWRGFTADARYDVIFHPGWVKAEP